LSFILADGFSKDGTGFRRIEYRTDERFGFPSRQDQHGALLEGALRGGFSAVQHEVRHGTTFQVRSAFNEEFLLLVQACIEAIDLGLGRAGLAGFGSGVSLRYQGCLIFRTVKTASFGHGSVTGRLRFGTCDAMPERAMRLRGCVTEP
jgi:hypothetical protein